MQMLLVGSKRFVYIKAKAFAEVWTNFLVAFISNFFHAHAIALHMNLLQGKFVSGSQEGI